MHGEFEFDNIEKHVYLFLLKNKDRYVFPIVFLKTENKNVGSSHMIGTFTSRQTMICYIFDRETINLTLEYEREIITLFA